MGTYKVPISLNKESYLYSLLKEMENNMKSFTNIKQIGIKNVSLIEGKDLEVYFKFMLNDGSMALDYNKMNFDISNYIEIICEEMNDSFLLKNSGKEIEFKIINKLRYLLNIDEIKKEVVNDISIKTIENKINKFLMNKYKVKKFDPKFISIRYDSVMEDFEIIRNSFLIVTLNNNVKILFGGDDTELLQDYKDICYWIDNNYEGVNPFLENSI